jgi:hypothetical protein
MRVMVFAIRRKPTLDKGRINRRICENSISGHVRYSKARGENSKLVLCYSYLVNKIDEGSLMRRRLY